MMKALGLTLSVACLCLACDPVLNIKNVPGEAGSEAGPPPDSGPVPDAEPPADGSTDGSTDDAGDAATDSGPTGHVIDGVNDFTPGETFATTSVSPNLYQGYVSWDATRMYFGMSGVDVGSGSSNKWVLVYLEGMAGTTQGVPFGGGVQQPTLPFSARYQLQWKTNNSYTHTAEWSGGSWVDATGTVPIQVMQSGNFVEFSVARANIGSPTTVKMMMYMVIEYGGDWSYAGVPSTTFTDGRNPPFLKYFNFDLTSTNAPNSFPALPP